MTPLEEVEVAGKTVLLRVDINSPIDAKTRKITNTNRIEKSLPTISYLLEQGAKLAMVAHQGDTCLLYTSPSPRDATLSRMPSSA